MNEIEWLRRLLRSRVPKRGEDPLASEAAVALLLKPGAQGLETLLIRRAEREGDPWSGHVALPGGRREARDPDLLATARRETHEELGIELPLEALLGELDDLSPRSAHLPRIVVRPFVFVLGSAPTIQLSAEVAGHQWVSLQQLRASAGTSEIVAGSDRWTVSSYRFGDAIVWGLTQRILEPFLELVS